MLVIYRIDQGLPLYLRAFRIDITGNLSKDSPVETLRDNLPVEAFNIKVQFIVKQLTISDFPCHSVIHDHGIARLIMDPLFA